MICYKCGEDLEAVAFKPLVCNNCIQMESDSHE